MLVKDPWVIADQRRLGEVCHATLAKSVDTPQWHHDKWRLIPRRQGLGEGWWSILACSMVAVDSGSWCAHPTALWTKVWAEDDWDAAHSFCPWHFSFAASCLSASNIETGISHWWAPAVSVWGLWLPWLRPDSHLCKLSLQLIFVTLSWSTTIAFSFLELAEEGWFGHVYIFHPCGKPNTAAHEARLAMIGRQAFLRTTSFYT